VRRVVYRLLRRFSVLDRWLRERLTPAGWLVLGAAGAAAAGGIDLNQTLTAQVFTFLSCLLLLAFLASRAFRARVDIRRQLPRYATAGEDFIYRVTVTNRGDATLVGATLAEQFRDPRPGYEEWRATREPGEERRNWFDRKIGYFRWRWLIERRIPEHATEAQLPALAPGESLVLRLAFTPRRRGRIELAGLNRTDWRCLDIIGTRGPMTAGQLAAAVRLTTGAVTGVLDRLEAAGLVRRIRDTQDRRRVIVEVTDELARQGAPVYGPLIADAAEAHAVFDVDELEVITRFIRIERELLAKHTERIAALKPRDRP